MAWERNEVEGRGTKKQEASRIRAWLCACRPVRDAACVRRFGCEWHGRGGLVRSGEAAKFEAARRPNLKWHGGKKMCEQKKNIRSVEGGYYAAPSIIPNVVSK